MTILPLESELGRDNDPLARKAMRRHIDELCRKVQEFDYLIVEVEFGIFADRPSLAARYIEQIVTAKGTRTALTLHSFLVPGKSSSLALSLVQGLFAGKPLRAGREWIGRREERKVKAFWRRLARLERERQLAIIHFNAFDASKLQALYGTSTKFVFPLVYFSDEERQARTIPAFRNKLMEDAAYKPNDVLVLFCGFLTPHKGLDVTLEAMRYLPKQFKLVVVGGRNISFYQGRLFERQDPYIERLNKTIREPSNSLENRVFFTGPLSDEGIELCFGAADIVILPYQETGQCTSGPGTLAAELSEKAVAANIRCFREIDAVFDGCFEFFEVGNPLQIAQQVEAVAKRSKRNAARPVTARDRAEVYKRALEACATR